MKPDKALAKKADDLMMAVVGLCVDRRVNGTPDPRRWKSIEQKCDALRDVLHPRKSA